MSPERPVRPALRHAVFFGLAASALLAAGIARAQPAELPQPAPPAKKAPTQASIDEEELVVLGDIRGRYPLEPPDTSSPRATLRTFFANARETWKIFFEPHESQRERYQSAGRRLRRAVRCLDLSEIPANAPEDTGLRTAIQLLDVLERIEMPRWSEIPDLATVEAEGLTRWRIPHTPIEVQRVESGPRQGEFLVTPETVARAEDFYLLTRHLEPREKAVIQDGYAFYRTLPGWMIPLRAIRALPGWMRTSFAGQVVWQWLLILLPLVPAGLVVGGLVRWSRRNARRDHLGSRLRALAVPVTVLGLAHLLGNVWLSQVGAGDAIHAIRLFYQLVLILCLAWISLQAGGIVAELILRSPAIDVRSVDASIVRIATRVASLVLAVFVLVEGARQLGVPVLGLLAGLGVGGLAVALAAQSTLENFIGSVTLFADRPVHVGDFCRFGSELGTVEQIGLRSTRIRTLGRSVITVPNAEFSRIQIDNFSHRDANLFRARVALSYDTTPGQLREVIEGLRRLLREHPRVLADPARVRLDDFGLHAFEIQIFAYVDEANWNQYLAIREELLLQITDAVEAAGARLAVPAQTTYLVAEEQSASAPDGSASS